MIDEILNNFKEHYNELGICYYPEDILGPDDLKPLYDYITHLQSNWNSLREWLENEESNSGYSISFRDSFRNVLSKMNELESGDLDEK